MANETDFIYLHGFASGPRSKKASYFQERLADCGITVNRLDLNQPSFAQMTLSSQIAHVGSVIDASKPNVLIGSSMGGLVATLASIRFPSVAALILLAPGFGIEKRWMDLVDPDRRGVWQREGSLEVFHYASQRNELLNYQFVEDLESYCTRDILVSVPTLIVHGKYDDVVPVDESRHFAENNNEYVQLVEVDDGHELIESLATSWTVFQEFLQQNSFFERTAVM